jgi:hypothetical protein
VSRTVAAGGVIKLRVQFKDDLGKATTAENAKVYLFAPGADTTDNANATPANTSFTPTYLGEGIYEYQFTAPCTSVTAAGDWSDKWVGDLTCQVGVTVTLTFPVTENISEVVSLESPQLFDNNLVSIKLLSGIASTAGDVLQEDTEFQFFTTLSPFYTSLTKVKLEVGSLVSEIKDLTSALSILESSIEADSLSFSTKEINSDLFKHARREYVTANAAFKLVNNVGGNLLRSKTLGDLSVTYDTSSHRDVLDHLQEMSRKWGDQLMSGGGARTVKSPKFVVRGALDPDRPIFDRIWGTTAGSNKTPIANYSQQSTTGRRSTRTYKKRWW